MHKVINYLQLLLLMQLIKLPGVSKSNFPVAKFRLLVAESKFGLTEEKLPSIFLSLIHSVSNGIDFKFIYLWEGDSYLSLLKDLLKKR